MSQDEMQYSILEHTRVIYRDVKNFSLKKKSIKYRSTGIELSGSLNLSKV